MRSIAYGYAWANMLAGKKFLRGQRRSGRADGGDSATAARLTTLPVQIIGTVQPAATAAAEEPGPTADRTDGMAPTLRGHVMGGVPGGSMREATIIAGASARLAFGSSTNWPVCWPGCRGRGAGGRGAGYSGAVQPRRVGSAAQARALWGVVLGADQAAGQHAGEYCG